MNKLSRKISALILCAALCLSCTASAFAAEEGIGEVKEFVKDETVYVLAEPDGGVRRIIVSDWIKNTPRADSIADFTELTELENVKGDEECTISENTAVWDARGNDIYYQGKTGKDLPVELTVSYELDGKKVSAEEIAGKSGKVSIRFDYKNRQRETVTLDGKEEKLYVPFAVLTGALLDNEHFRNVTVSNGRLVNDGDRTAVVGFAFPGLQENLNIGKDKLELPDHVEITADVTDFSLGMTVTVAVNSLFDSLDAAKFDSVDGMTDSVGELAAGMEQLLDGSSALSAGLSTLLDKSKELTAGIDQLAGGAKALKDGTVSLDDGAGQVKVGSAELSTGLDTLKSNNDALNNGAKQVFETLLSTAETQITAGGIAVPALTIDNYSQVLDEIIDSLDEDAVYAQALAQVTAAVEENRPLIVEKVTAAVREQAEAQVMAAVREQVSDGVVSAVREQVSEKVILSAARMSKADYEAAVSAGAIPEENETAVSAAIEAQMQTEEVQALIEATIAEKMGSDEIRSAVKANTDAQMQTEAVQKTISDNVETQITKAISDNMASDEVQSRLTAASEGAKSIAALKSSLDSFNTFYLGLLSYTESVASAADGASALAAGASDLKDGTSQLKDGASALNDGITEMKDASPALTEGVSQLKDGAMQLSDGLIKFNEEGIQKIIDLVNGDLDDLAARLRATIEASWKYRNFSGINDNMDGQVKFVYRTDEIN